MPAQNKSACGVRDRGRLQRARRRSGARAPRRTRAQIQALEWQAGRPFPPVSFAGADGGRVMRDQLIDGRTTVLLFFSPSCDICQRELKALASAAPAFGAAVRTVTVSWREPRHSAFHSPRVAVHRVMGSGSRLRWRLQRYGAVAMVIDARHDRRRAHRRTATSGSHRARPAACLGRRHGWRSRGRGERPRRRPSGDRDRQRGGRPRVTLMASR